MARYQIILTYDGTQFVGSQRQADSRTVQHELELALSQLGWTGRSILLAGRTDSGVHALGQVAAFDLEWKQTLKKLQNALNARLPKDMAVKQLLPAADDFHPRFAATSRCYLYRLYFQPQRDPMKDNFCWRIWPALSGLEPLAGLWPGTHDFSAFGTPPKAGNSTERTVISASWQNIGDELQFRIRANAFLYHMVRRIVYAQVAVCQGKITSKDLQFALEKGSELPSGLAPARGLTLLEVSYD